MNRHNYQGSSSNSQNYYQNNNLRQAGDNPYQQHQQQQQQQQQYQQANAQIQYQQQQQQSYNYPQLSNSYQLPIHKSNQQANYNQPQAYQQTPFSYQNNFNQLQTSSNRSQQDNYERLTYPQKVTQQQVLQTLEKVANFSNNSRSNSKDSSKSGSSEEEEEDDNDEDKSSEEEEEKKNKSDQDEESDNNTSTSSERSSKSSVSEKSSSKSDESENEEQNKSEEKSHKNSESDEESEDDPTPVKEVQLKPKKQNKKKSKKQTKPKQVKKQAEDLPNESIVGEYLSKSGFVFKSEEQIGKIRKELSEVNTFLNTFEEELNTVFPFLSNSNIHFDKKKDINERNQYLKEKVGIVEQGQYNQIKHNIESIINDHKKQMLHNSYAGQLDTQFQNQDQHAQQNTYQIKNQSLAKSIDQQLSAQERIIDDDNDNDISDLKSYKYQSQLDTHKLQPIKGNNYQESLNYNYDQSISYLPSTSTYQNLRKDELVSPIPSQTILNNQQNTNRQSKQSGDNSDQISLSSSQQLNRRLNQKPPQINRSIQQQNKQQVNESQRVVYDKQQDDRTYHEELSNHSSDKHQIGYNNNSQQDQYNFSFKNQEDRFIRRKN